MTNVKIPLIDLRVQHDFIKEEISHAIEKVVNSSQFILGEEVAVFEKEFAKYCQAKYAVGVDSGLSALELGMRALGIGEGDEVLTPVNSFIASASAISFTGATPVLVDCREDTYNIDIKDAEKKLSKKTKAIMPVHLYGQPVDCDDIERFARSYKLHIIEDACQAHGATFGNKRVGTFSDFAAFSFYPGKNLGAWGDAGCLVTGSKKIYQIVLQMRNYGQRKKYYHSFLAWNRRLDTLQAAVLLVKVKYLDKWNRRRQDVAGEYNRQLSGIFLKLPEVAPGRTHVYHQFVIRTKKRNHLQRYLQLKGISTGIHYPVPIHLQKAYSHLGGKIGDFPVTEMLAGEILSLPMYPELSVEQIKYISKTIKEVL